MWTYLFQQLNKALSSILSQCSLSQSTEFCEGVIATLENSREDFRRLKHKIEIENGEQLKERPLA